MSFLNSLFKKQISGVEEQRKEKNVILSPLKGKVIPLEEVSDPAFAQGILGVGAAILPEEGKVYSPVDGTVAAAFPTGHAIGLLSEDGVEILIHAGIDTVRLKGDGFELMVDQGDQVKAGQLLMTFDTEKIKDAGYETTTMVLVSNAQNFGAMKLLCGASVAPGDKLFGFEEER